MAGELSRSFLTETKIATFCSSTCWKVQAMLDTLRVVLYGSFLAETNCNFWFFCMLESAGYMHMLGQW